MMLEGTISSIEPGGQRRQPTLFKMKTGVQESLIMRNAIR